MFVTHGEWHTCKSILPSRLQCMPPTVSDIHARAYYHHDSCICHQRRVIYMEEHITKHLVHVPHGEWHVCTSTSLRLQCMSPMVSDLHAWAHHHDDSSVCHPWQVTHMQESDAIMALVYATHGEWHIWKSLSQCLQCVSCHPWWVTCMQEHDAQNKSQMIPWLILQRAYKTQGSSLVSSFFY